MSRVVSGTWVVGLPMYDYPELRAAHRRFWQGLRDRLRDGGVEGVPEALEQGLDARGLWRHPRVLFAQGCEYPLAVSGARVRLVARPHYLAVGCEGPDYCSAIIVRQEEQARTLDELAHRRCVLNEPDSNSGMNLLRAALAPMSGGKPVFDAVLISGSHRRSLEMIAHGEADVAAIDCISLAHFRKLCPALVARTRTIGWTPRSPSPPFITASETPVSVIQVIRAALADIFQDGELEEVRGQLLLGDIDLQPQGNYSEVLALAEQGASFGLQATNS